MRSTVPTLAAAAAVAAGLVLSVAAPASAVHEEIEVTGLTQGHKLVTFLAGNPGDITSTVKIKGLGGDLLGIDYRPATGQVVSRTALRTAAGAPVVLSGSSFGVDFNPAADALRIVSDADQNLRVLPSDRPAGVVGTTFVDGALTPAGLAVTAAAYVNNDTDPATGTTLYDLSSATDGLFVQNPPNDGTLVAVGTGLGLPVGSKAGFDVYTEGTSNVALVSLVDRGRTTISVLDLATGAVTPASTARIGSNPPVVDIAVPTRQ